MDIVEVAMKEVARITDKAFAEQAATITALRARVAELEGALGALVTLNDEHSPFGGELYRDRIERTWDRARAAAVALIDSLLPENTP